MNKSLKSFVFFLILFMAVGLFTSVYFFSTYLHAKLSRSEAVKTSNAISEQVFASMYQIMRKGWSRQEMEDFLGSTRDAFEHSSTQITVYRGPLVEALYGKVAQKQLTEHSLSVFHSKIKTAYESPDGKIVTSMPLIARHECLLCHTNAHSGEVLGVIETSYDLASLTRETEEHYRLFFLLIIIPAAAAVFFLSRLFIRRLERSIQEFDSRITQIDSLKDFKELEVQDINLGFDELNTLLSHVNHLADKLKNIAVDKDLLEFEIRLLDKFIITSDVVKDWREYITELLIEINTVMDAYSLITIFQVGDETYEVEVFWRYVPDTKTRNTMEELAFKALSESLGYDERTLFQINHTVADSSLDLVPLSAEEIQMQTKSLFLEMPKIGGIVGIGVQSLLVTDPIRHIVIEGILSTLINLVGSVKAIHKYTKDLEYYATRDPLTSLFNQRVFRDLLEYEVKRAAHHDYTFAVFVIDCDNFKPINDRFGHSFGDEFLQHFATIIKSASRSEDIVARYGGDEFAIILPECRESEAYQIAERLLHAIESFELIAPNGEKVQTTVSLGIAMYPDHSTTPKELFTVADGMMYRAKHHGKNTIGFPDQDDIARVFQQTQDKTILVLEALKNDKIVPYFQPIMDIASGEIAIHELLMRIEVDQSMIAAGEFIEIAETIGVIHKMDYIVIEKAFAYIAQSGYQGILFINLSPRSLIIAEFLDKITKLVDEYGLVKSNIVFEITERETVKSFALLEKFVRNLTMEGFRFAIDDFGSGFSTFHYIKKFPIDYIKIDGDFILNLDKDPKDLAFVKSIVALSQELHVKCVAEFVENEEILTFLRDIGVDYAQGYHISRPSKTFYLPKKD